MIYHSSSEGAIELLKKKLEIIDDERQLLLVLYKSQIYSVHSASLSGIFIYPLSTIVYEADASKLYRDYGAQFNLKHSANDPEYLNVLDQAISNEPVTFHYIPVPKPRYSKYKKYFVAQIILKSGESNDNQLGSL